MLRWTWRVAYYAYGALGTDRYPPFTLGEAPDYPATLDVAYPEHLRAASCWSSGGCSPYRTTWSSAFFLGSGSYAAYQATGASASNGGWSAGNGGLIGLLVLIAGIVLLFTGRYPRGVFDLLLGLHRWVLRVAAYAALMTDAYPPFRLDLGGADPADLPLADGGGGGRGGGRGGGGGGGGGGGRRGGGEGQGGEGRAGAEGGGGRRGDSR